ncbi:MAG TPA: phospholipase D family protein [Casimicrobiaceae bacterium]|nr:phospholipase D family protein [Casimicrobiaceae bacterium]
MPPGASYPKNESFALERPADTAIGRKVETRAKAHPGLSGFRLFASGTDALALRVQMADAAEKTLDVQYFIFKDDDSGQLLMSAILRAAARGVRVRMLIDDTEARGADDRVATLAAHPNIEVRLYNPFYYRGDVTALRYAELTLTLSRLNYRMHNKLFVADNEVAVVGGRNVGDAYFDTGASLQFGDYDVFALGPIARELSASFDQYWNSKLAIPAEALSQASFTRLRLWRMERELAEHADEVRQSELGRAIASGKPYAGLIGGDSGLVWAKAQVIADYPDKGNLDGGVAIGSLLRERLLDAAAAVKSELLIVSPYFVPGDDVAQLLRSLRARRVRVRVLTNSLLSTDVPAVHAGYRGHRVPLLEEGVALYEVKPLPGKPDPRGGLLKTPSSGQFALHAKAYVFDRKRVFIGSANLDPRSLDLNTEIGLLIDSPELARQVAKRFDTMAAPANSFVLALAGAGNSRHVVWRSEKDGEATVYKTEPGEDRLRGFKVDLMALLPIDGLL